MKIFRIPFTISPGGKRRFSRVANATAAMLLACRGIPDCAAQQQNGTNSPQTQNLTAMSIEQLGTLTVTSASLHEQMLQDAPGNVTVITAQEIREWGCRTLSDALSRVGGFYATSDYTYTAMGIRGFSLPGFETRYILMINGHNMSENISDSTFVGTDLPLDMELVERIEIVRGAASALYGSNAMLATINVITRKPADMPGVTVRMETGSLGERRTGAYTAIALGSRANLLVGLTVFNDAGAHQLYFPEFDAPGTNFGRALDMDGQKGYRTFADLTWGNWEALVIAGDRVKIQPISWGDTVFNDRGTRAEDSRGFFELSYRRDLPGDRTLNWRTSYDEYRYRGIYRYAEEDGISDSRERDYGDWLSSEVTWRMPDFHHGHLTLGTEAKLDLRALQNAFDTGPEETPLLRVNRRDRYVGVFAQQEWTWGSHWELNAGARFDWSWLKQSAISPRLAVIYKPTGATDLKLVYGRGFRNASSYDRFWEDGITQIANPSLRPERTDAYELDIDHTVSRRLRTSASVYRYQVNDLIEQVYTEAGLAQYVNSERVRASGVSLELEWALPRAIQLSSSLELQRAVFRSTQVLPNSPGQVAKLRLKVPILGDRLTLVGGIQALGQRQTIGGVTLPWVIVPDVVVSAGKMGGGLEFSAGINNLSNGFYRDPVGLTPAVDSVIAAGRTYFVNVTWHSTETPLHARSDRLDPQKRSRETPPSREP